MRLRKPSYFAPLSLGAGGVWGSAESPDDAVKNCCRQALGFASAMGGFQKDTRLAINVYSIREGCYAYQDARGIFEVDDELDVIVAYATPAFRYEEVDPKRPLTTCRLGDPFADYEDDGEALAACNANRTAPIGEWVKA